MNVFKTALPDSNNSSEVEESDDSASNTAVGRILRRLEKAKKRGDKDELPKIRLELGTVV